VNTKEAIESIKSGAAQIYSEHGLNERLQSGKVLTIKFGADPSRPDLHLGHSVVLRKLRLFQELGHRIQFVIGDFTAMIGDPTGKNKARPTLTLEETRASGDTYFRQVAKILDPEHTEVAYNSSWLASMQLSDIINLCSKYTAARILERDDFQNRLTQHQPIAMHELLYPLLQGYDSVALSSDVEVGGTDQTFNLLVGRVLQSNFGQVPQEVITYPLLIGLDGKEKMSKSLDNFIGIDEPADIMFEKAMQVPDPLLADYFVLTTDTLAAEAGRIIQRDVREAHLQYAYKITEMYHTRAAAEKAKDRYLQVAGGAAPADMTAYAVNAREIRISELLQKVGFAVSASEARRYVVGRGVKIDGVTVEDPLLVIQTSKPVVVQLGKNRFVRVHFRPVQD
jgi:tyrosyl-tRNA synthetase